MLAPQHRLQVRLYDPLLQVRRGLVLGSPPSGGAHPPEPQPARRRAPCESCARSQPITTAPHARPCAARSLYLCVLVLQCRRGGGTHAILNLANWFRACLPRQTSARGDRRRKSDTRTNRVSPTTNAAIAALDHLGGLAGWFGPAACTPPLAHASVLRLGRPPRSSEGCAERGSGRGFRGGVPTGAHERRRRPVPCAAPPGGRGAGAARRRPRTLARLRDSAASTWPVRAACVRADGGGTVARGARRRGGRAARRRGRGRPRHPRARRAARGAAARGHLSA